MKLSALYEAHKKFFESSEKDKFLRAHRYYNGQFYDSAARSARYAENSNVAAMSLSSKNIVYSIVDTALALLIGNSLGVAMNPRSRFSEQRRAEVEAYMDWVFSVNQLRQQSTTALLDAVLCGRGCFKTMWNAEKDVAETSVVRPPALFFDLESRFTGKISYFLETTPISMAEFERRVDCGQYKGKKLSQVKPEGYPSWMEMGDPDRNALRKAFRWVHVVEYWDVVGCKVQHWIPQINEVVFEESVPFHPYSLFYLSPNGEDCRGLSEVQLILDDQEAVNAMKSLLNEIAMLAIKKFVFDDRYLDPEQAARIASAALGSWTPLGRGEGSAPGGQPLRLEDLFSAVPHPESPQPVLDAIARATEDAAFVTAFADQSRGQVRNVRTATEMAFVDAQLQTRTANRRAMFFEGVESVAQKSLAYAKEYMKGPHEVKMAGDGGWVEVDRWIADVVAEWQCVAYNPLRDNPAVLGERVLALLPVLPNLPRIDQDRLTVFLVDCLHLPAYLIKTDDQILAEAEAAAAAQAPQEMSPDVAALPPELAAAQPPVM